MKKLLILLTFLFVLPFTVSAESQVESPQGYMGYAWTTDSETIQKDKTLQLVTENGADKIYFSETDSSKDILAFYVFAEEKLVSGVLQFKYAPDYQEAVTELRKHFGNPHKEDTQNGYLGWQFQNTSIIATDKTEPPSITFFYQ